MVHAIVIVHERPLHERPPGHGHMMYLNINNFVPRLGSQDTSKYLKTVYFFKVTNVKHFLPISDRDNSDYTVDSATMCAVLVTTALRSIKWHTGSFAQHRLHMPKTP